MVKKNNGTITSWNSAKHKRNILLIHTKTWMNPKGIMLSEKKSSSRRSYAVFIQNMHLHEICIHIRCPERQSFKGRNQINDSLRLGGDGCG
jgi:hypothetical protein